MMNLKHYIHKIIYAIIILMMARVLYVVYDVYSIRHIESNGLLQKDEISKIVMKINDIEKCKKNGYLKYKNLFCHALLFDHENKKIKISKNINNMYDIHVYVNYNDNYHKYGYVKYELDDKFNLVKKNRIERQIF
jgi:hypothetical protein